MLLMKDLIPTRSLILLQICVGSYNSRAVGDFREANSTIYLQLQKVLCASRIPHNAAINALRKYVLI
jgi:hypothetical protein